MSTQKRSNFLAIAAAAVTLAAYGQGVAFHRTERDKDSRSASLAEELMRKAEEKRQRKAAKRRKEQP